MTTAAQQLAGEQAFRSALAGEDLTSKGQSGPDPAAGSTTFENTRTQELRGWEQSGLDTQLQSLISEGNFSGAFATASQSGQLEAMLDPYNLEHLASTGFTKQQFEQYYQAFAPYQNRLMGSADSSPGFNQPDETWMPANPTSEAAQNWAAIKGDPLLYGSSTPVPTPGAFGGEGHFPGVFQADVLPVLEIAAAVVAPEAAGAIAGGLGVSTAAGGAIYGTAVGAAGAAAGGKNVGEGALIGAAGGALAGGVAGDISQETGIPQQAVSIGARTGMGALTGGTTGAEAGLAGGAIGAGLQEAGVPQALSGPAGSFLGSAASSALSSPTGATMPSSTGTALDPAAAGVIGAVPAMATGTMGMPPQVGSGGATSPAGVASPATSPTTDSTLGSELETLFGAPTAGNAMSGLGTYGLLAGLGIYGANQATSSNNSAIAPATAIGAPLAAAGQQMLGGAMSGQLSPLQQQALTTGQQQGKTLVNAATPVGQIAQQYMKQFQSGQLLPADQAQLDQNVASAKAQMLQALGPNVDSTTAATYMNQIDQQALITKQQIQNSYLATGNQEFDQWAQATEAGQATITAAQNQAVSNIDQNFQNAFAASGLGAQTILSAIGMTLQQNTQVATALQSYMGNLTKAFALQKAGGAIAGGAAGAAAGAVADTGASTYGSGYTQTGASSVGVTPVDVNANPQYQAIEQGQEDALYSTLSDSQGGATSYGINDPSAPPSPALQQVLSGPSFSSQASSGMAAYSNFAGGAYYG